MPSRHSVLLDFEVDTDRLFVEVSPGQGAVKPAPEKADQAMRIAAGTERVRFKLPSLMSGRAFPGEWTLLSLALYSESEGAVELSYESASGAQLNSIISIPPSQWTPAMLDLSSLGGGGAAVGTLSLRYRSGATGGSLWIDDLALINNAEVIYAGGEGEWRIQRRGLRISIERPQLFALHLATSESPTGGWSLVEANALRARFKSNRNSETDLTVYSDGRVFKDGAFSAASAVVRDDPRYSAAHDSPATVEVDEAFGRVVRNSPGDADNDGYNEVLGAYLLNASQRRLQVRFTPNSRTIPRPVLQIAGLPKGNLRISVEGRWIDDWQRLPDGQVLVILPLALERATTINVRLE